MNADDSIFTGRVITSWNLKFVVAMLLVNSISPGQYYSAVFTTSKDGLGLHNSTTNNVTLSHFWEFETFTEEFELINENAWVSETYHLIAAAGAVIGSVFMGINDMFGRLIVFKVCSVIYLFAYCTIGISKDCISILIGRLVLGIIFPIMKSSAFALMTETIPLEYRTWAGLSMALSFNMALVILGVSAYIIRSWRVLHLALGLPIYVLPFFTFLLDESPRWLIEQKKYEEACRILKKIEMNKKRSDESMKTLILLGRQVSGKEEESLKLISQAKQSLHSLFGTRRMHKLIIAMPLVWFSMSIGTFAIPLDVKNFINNHYLYMIMLGVTGTPWTFILPMMVHKYRNITSLSVCFICLGLTSLWMISLTSSAWWLASILCTFILPLIVLVYSNLPSQSLCFIFLGIIMLWIIHLSSSAWWMKWLLLSLGINLSAATLQLTRLVTVELLPTTLRTTYFGICNVTFYLGAFTASYIHSISPLELRWLFYAVCSVSSVMAAFIVRWLPETHGKYLQANIEDVFSQVERLEIDKKIMARRRWRILRLARLATLFNKNG